MRQVLKNIPFKTRSGETRFPADDGDRRGGRRRVRAVFGDLRHVTLFIPFRLFIEIPGAMEGDTCEVVQACILGEVDTLIDDNDDGLFERLEETIDIDVTVRVIRKTVVNVTGARRTLMASNVVFQR
jgi:hypothetical protein